MDPRMGGSSKGMKWGVIGFAVGLVHSAMFVHGFVTSRHFETAKWYDTPKHANFLGVEASRFANSLFTEYEIVEDSDLKPGTYTSPWDGGE